MENIISISGQHFLSNNASLLIDKINSYKSYSEQVKNHLIDQVINQDKRAKGITEEMYNQVLIRIPSTLKNTKEYFQEYNKIKKLVVGLERHQFAPELNTLHLQSGKKTKQIKTPQATEIEQAIKYVISNKKDYKFN